MSVPSAALLSAWPERGEQLRGLCELLGPACLPGGAPLAPLLVCGPPGSGKTGCVRAVLRHLRRSAGVEHAYVSLVEAHSPRLLFATLLEDLGVPPKDVERGCAGAEAFVEALRAGLPATPAAAAAAPGASPPPALVLVVDDAHRLARPSYGDAAARADLLGALLRVGERVNGCTRDVAPSAGANWAAPPHFPPRVATLLVSSAPWAALLDHRPGAPAPECVPFPGYSLGEAAAVLRWHAPPWPAPRPGGLPPLPPAASARLASLWPAFLGAALPVLLPSCADPLRELRDAPLAPLWRAYIRPLAADPLASAAQLYTRLMFPLGGGAAFAGGGGGGAGGGCGGGTVNAGQCVPLSTAALALGSGEWPPPPPSSQAAGLLARPGLGRLLLLAAHVASRLPPATWEDARWADDLATGCLAQPQPAPAAAAAAGGAGGGGEGDGGGMAMEPAPGPRRAGAAAGRGRGGRGRGRGGRGRGGQGGGGGAARARAAREARAVAAARLSGPQPVALDRLLAWTQVMAAAVQRDGDPAATWGGARGGGGGGARGCGAADLPPFCPLQAACLQQLGSLVEAGLLRREGADPAAGCRFRPGFGPELAESLARGCGLRLQDLLANRG